MADVAAPLARTPLYQWHKSRNARMAEADGWHVAAGYDSVEAEATVARSRVALVDVSSFSKINLIGQAVPLLTWSVMGMSTAMKPHGVTPFLANGPVLGCRLAEDQLLLLASSTTATGLEQYLANATRGQPVLQNNVTSGFAGFWLVGPAADGLVRRLSSLDLIGNLPEEASCAETQFAGVHALLVRSPELQVPSVRVYVTWDLGEYVWETLFEAGATLQAMPMGLDALHSLRKPA